MRGRRIVAIGLATAAVCGGAWAYGVYYVAFLWPAKIQREVLGDEVASHAQLLSRESHFAYGEGFARWRYQLDVAGSRVAALCTNMPVSRCSFSRSREIDEGVTVIVGYKRGVLTVEEWWS